MLFYHGSLYLSLVRNTLFPFFLLFFGLMLFCACDHNGAENPKVRFERPFDQRRMSLKRILHERFKFQGDTNIYKVDFERRTKLNHLIHLNTGDTILHCFVSKNDDLWVVSEPLDSLGYLIWAFKTEDDRVYAWGSRQAQHWALIAPFAQEGVFHAEAGVQIVPTQEEQLLSTLRKVILPNSTDALVIERLSRRDVRQALQDELTESSDEDELDEAQEMPSEDAPQQEQSAIVNVYPQPAKTGLKLEMANSGDYLIKCFDMNGAPFREFNKSGSTLSLDVSNWDNGNYILAVFNADGLLLDQKKVVVGR